MCSEPSSIPNSLGAPPARQRNVFQRRRMEQQYQRALQRMQKPGGDGRQVHQMLSECASTDPAAVQYAEALLRNLAQAAERGAENHQISPAESLAPLYAWAESGDWATLLQKGLSLLWDLPGNGDLCALLGRACLADEHPRTGLIYIQWALRQNPEHVELNRQAAQALTALRRWDQAIQHWQTVERIDPRDDEPPRCIAALIVQKTRQESDASEHGPSPTEKPTENEAQLGTSRRTEADSEPTAATLKLTTRQRLEQAIVQNPQNETGYINVADYYIAQERYFEAQQTLAKGTQFCDSLILVERLEDVSLLRAQQLVDQARRGAEEQRTSEAFDLVDQREAERQQLEFGVIQARSSRHPENKSLRFQWGIQLKRQGKLRAAVEPLQAGLDLPEHRAEASLEIGEILQRYRQFPKALQCYRQAAQLATPRSGKKNVPGDTRVRHRALYRAGVLATDMGLPDSARAYLSELVRTAGDYQDARPRLDKLSEIDDDT